MSTTKLITVQAGFALLIVAGLTDSAVAQNFAYTNNDLLIGFRKTGAFQETNKPVEVVGNIGKAANYVQAPLGTSFAVPGFSPTQLVPGSFTNLDHLNWSVVGFSKTNLIQVLPGYVNNVLWVTVPRTVPNVQTVAPTRMSYSAQALCGVQINSIGANAVLISSQTASNEYDNITFIREPINDPRDLTSYIGGVASSSDSTLRDTWTQNLENSTPDGFNNCGISDLYEVWPRTDSLNRPVTDPHTGLTNGPAYYVGYFQFCPDGSMLFVRASPTPVPPQLTIGYTGTNITISFSTMSGSVYTLYYTNAFGLSSPATTWPSWPITITGDGSVKSFEDSSPNSERFYRVGVR